MTATLETPESTSRPRGAKAKKAPAKKAPPKPKTKPAAKSKASAADREVTWPNPVKPSLVLLPAKVRGARARRKAIRGATIMSVGLLGLTVVGYISVSAASSVAQNGLEAEMAKTASQQKVLDANKPVQDFYDGLTARREAAVAALQNDVSNTNVLKALDSANTVGATFKSITKTADASACPVVDPFLPSQAIGCLQVSGITSSVADVGRLSSALLGNKEILTAPYVTATADGDKATSFELTVGFTSKALSNKGQPFSGEAAGSSEDNQPAPSTGTPQEAKK